MDKYIVNCEECGQEFPSEEQTPEMPYPMCPLCYEDYCVNEAFKAMDEEYEEKQI